MDNLQSALSKSKVQLKLIITVKYLLITFYTLSRGYTGLYGNYKGKRKNLLQFFRGFIIGSRIRQMGAYIIKLRNMIRRFIILLSYNKESIAFGWRD